MVVPDYWLSPAPSVAVFVVIHPPFYRLYLSPRLGSAAVFRSDHAHTQRRHDAAAAAFIAVTAAASMPACHCYTARRRRCDRFSLRALILRLRRRAISVSSCWLRSGFGTSPGGLPVHPRDAGWLRKLHFAISVVHAGVSKGN